MTIWEPLVAITIILGLPFLANLLPKGAVQDILCKLWQTILATLFCFVPARLYFWLRPSNFLISIILILQLIFLVLWLWLMIDKIWRKIRG